MEKLKFGIAGFGKMGRIREQSISLSNDAVLLATYDIESSRSEDSTVLSCSSLDELLESEIDAIIISTYVSFSADYVVRALDSGKHVFCEKPPAMNSGEMSKVLEAEKRSQKILKYGFNHRMHYSTIEAKRMIDEGDLGKLLWMRGIYGKAGSIDYHDNWRNYKNYSGGGILFDQGIHMLDLFRYFTDSEFECLSAYLSSSFWKVDCEDNAFVTLKSSNNVLATLHSSATQWRHKFLLEMTFEDGYLNLDGILSTTRSYAPETLVYGRREFEDITFAMGKPKESTVYFESDESWNFELLEFINAIQGKSKIINGSSNDAEEIMKLTDAIYESAEKF